ncbi:respiratory nitrate reductase subunit gamma [Roseococcus sp. SDR]|uniref:respiratory nitrate reductase subunit gamma n=1 Tax=Roseococcus sp. SDR TaxID=2835532 RepID=UPI001BCACAD1|nr:respiratory nitrate reductase subunit gamma [Roseococcus sp. SDR]MBS7792685.1 respiratory nitrate reductase subunit gamma [Roseococcus sp. SDR]MBV1847999.1 respiratory nitrate reductase subunit gamma [Roseococcus sp. SDR]
MRDAIFHILFVWYPYVALTAFLLGSLIRFDREQYSWRASSSQILRKRQLAWGSNLFHAGVLFLFLGHAAGLLTPKFIYTLFITVEQKQLIAVIAGGIAGLICFIGLTLLLHRRLYDPRIRVTSTYMDLAVLMILWVQLSLGLLTLPFSLAHSDGSAMLVLAHWAQGILTLQPVDAKTLQGLSFPYLAHLVLGMTIFLIFPFSRLVHVWSAPVWYLGRRGYQVVRSRRPITVKQAAE